MVVLKKQGGDTEGLTRSKTGFPRRLPKGIWRRVLEAGYEGFFGEVPLRGQIS